ncbi:hypothetical protein FS749_015418 [Ceratobasidium sp. UAMH 11750]|nr:hypothetical protein FS749_015418 [Ceratobasidium sp. UAMH 11750]
MSPDKSSKRARLGPHLNPPSHATGANLQSQPSSSATGANQLNAQAATPSPAILPATSSTSQNIRVFKLRNPFRVLGTVATVIPPLQPVMDLLAEGMDGLSISSGNSQDYEVFLTDITTTVETLKGHLSHPSPVILTESISNTIEELEKQAEYIKKRQERSGGKRLMDAEQDEADLMRRYRQVEALLRRLNIDIGIAASRITHGTLDVANRGLDIASAGLDVTRETRNVVERHLSHARMEEMDPVKEARYNSGAKEVRRTGCTSAEWRGVHEHVIRSFSSNMILST